MEDLDASKQETGRRLHPYMEFFSLLLVSTVFRCRRNLTEQHGILLRSEEQKTGSSGSNHACMLLLLYRGEIGHFCKVVGGRDTYR